MVRDSFSAKVIIEASQKSVLKKLQVTQLEYPVSFQKDSIQIQTGRELEQTEAPRELRGKEYGPDRCFFVSSYTGNRSMLEYKSRFVGDKSSPLG